MAIDNREGTNGHKRSSICKAEREREKEREYQTTAMEPVENRCFIRFGLSTSGKRRKTIIAFSRGLQRKYCHCRRGQSAVDGINLA